MHAKNEPTNDRPKGRPCAMPSIPVVVIGSFLLAFKAVLIEGSEVTILSLATVKRIGKNNVLLGVALGGLGSVITFLLVRQLFLFLSDITIDLVAGTVILYFSYRFLKGFYKYYFGGKSFRLKMEKMEEELVAKEVGHAHAGSRTAEIPFSITNSLPVFSITMTEGFEASLILATAGTFNLEWTAVGAVLSITVLVLVSLKSYDYLMRFPRWLLDLVGGSVLLLFGTLFFLSGILQALGV
jgi:uncharacterized membrane protein